MKPEKTEAPKKGATLWKKGQSGNPAGRPKGAKGKATELRKAIEEGALGRLESDMPKLIEMALDMALSGNETMLKFCLERFLPKAVLGEKESNAGIGGIVINVKSIEEISTIKPVIEGEAADD